MTTAGVRDLVISPMSAEDIGCVHAIETASFTVPWSEALFLAELGNTLSRPMVARCAGAIVGYLCASLVIDEGHILDLAVHPSYRGQGIARSLMAETLEHMKLQGCSSVFLEVRASHAAVIRFYEQCGFAVTQTRLCYYVSPIDDAAIMVRSFEPRETPRPAATENDKPLKNRDRGGDQ